MERVILGFSGGIDSVTAARFLSERGLGVTALTLDTTGDVELVERARAAAAEVGAEHVVRDVRDVFSTQIVDYFVLSYVAGRTPSPCVRCNPLIKWRYLIEEADRRGVRFVATGHYFNIAERNGRFYVSRADDRTKDQSYYLWGLSQSVLSRALTPMGHAVKSEIKARFEDKRESMGLCFLQGRSCREFMERRYPAASRGGEIVDKQGRAVGRHDGIAFYTIGQKRGLDGVVGRRVVAIDAERNRLVVGDDADLYYETLEIGECNIVDEEEFLTADDIEVVIRGVGRNPEGRMRRAERIAGGYRILLGGAAWAPAAGQPVVFYRGDRVVGGGITTRFR